MAKKAKYVVTCRAKKGGPATVRTYHDKQKPAKRKAAALVKKARTTRRCEVRSAAKRTVVFIIGSF